MTDAEAGNHEDRLRWLLNHWGAYDGSCWSGQDADGNCRLAVRVKWRITDHDWRREHPHDGNFTTTIVRHIPHAESTGGKPMFELFGEAIDKAATVHDWAVEHCNMPAPDAELLNFEKFAEKLRKPRKPKVGAP